MPKVKIKRGRCKGCRLCVVYCPKKVLEMETALNDFGIAPAVVAREADCTACGICFLMCPDVCIEIEGSGA